MHKIFSFLISIFCIHSCGDATETPLQTEDLAVLSIVDVSIQESAPNMIFEVVADKIGDTDILINFTSNELTAQSGIDFVGTTGSVVLPAGQRRIELLIPILEDDIKEVDEKIEVTITSDAFVEISDDTAIGVILDNDVSQYDDSGYTTSGDHFGYTLSWNDEFDEGEIDPSSYNFEIGDGCPNLCGWGNNELQTYTDDPTNAYIQDGSLVIRARATSASSYSSSRITTKDKREFRYGRVDIRAKITKGQGIWPAIWMLGHNIDDVGWPACGEIDIMENVGHEPRTVHGTAHWGPQGRGYSTFTGSPFIIDEDFNNRFHVFSLVWEPNKLDWYIDENKFHSITPLDMQGEEYRFNQEFFLIFNVAVGGNWPGNPDETTEFPQQMEIDYIRFFQ